MLLLAGNGKGFCGGYDLVESAEGQGRRQTTPAGPPPAGSPLDPAVMVANHDPAATWDPMVDYAMMSRNVRALHVAVSLQQAGRLQGPRLLRGRRAPTWRCARTCW